MFPTSDLFKQKIQDNAREFKLKINILLKDNTLLTLTDNDVVMGSFGFIEDTQPTEYFNVGGTVASHTSFEIYNIPAYKGKNFIEAVVMPYVGLYIEELDDYEFVQIGHFHIDDVTVSRNTIVVKAIDSLIKADIKYMESAIFPQTLDWIYKDACSQAGIPIAEQTFQNMNYEVLRPIGKTVSCRKMIQYVAELSGTFAKVNRYGELELRWYQGTDKVITPHHRVNFEPRGDRVGVRGVMTEKHGIIYLEGTWQNSLNITDNPLLQSNYKDIVFAIFASVKDISFVPYECEWQGDPSIQAGDVVNHVALDGTNYKTLVTRTEYNYRGKCKLFGKGLPDIAMNYNGTSTANPYIRARETDLVQLDYYDDGFVVNDKNKFKWIPEGLLKMNDDTVIPINHVGGSIPDGGGGSQ